MAFTTSTKMVILYGNTINPTDVSVSTSNFSIQTSADHLTYQDPGRVFKATASAGAQIELTGMDSYLSAVGFIRHNLQNHATVTVEFKDLIAGTWVTEGTWGSGVSYDWDVGLHGDGRSGSGARFTWSGASGQFYLGSIFVGQKYEVQTNPRNNSFVYNTSMPYIVEESEGGTKHVVTRATFDTHRLDWTVQMAKEADVQFMHELRQNSRGSIIGVIPPHETDAVGVSAVNHFFGYLDGIITRPRSSTTADRRYDMQISMIGV